MICHKEKRVFVTHINIMKMNIARPVRGTKALINPNLNKTSYTLFWIFNPSFFLNIFESMNNIINSQRNNIGKINDIKIDSAQFCNKPK